MNDDNKQVIDIMEACIFVEKTVQLRGTHAAEEHRRRNNAILKNLSGIKDGVDD